MTSSIGKSLPDDPYYLTESENQTLSLALLRLQARCIESYGLSDPFPQASRQRPVGPERIEYRYLLTDTSQARRYGYEPPPNAADDASRALTRALADVRYSPEQELVIFGPGGPAAVKARQVAEISGQTPPAASPGIYAGRSVPVGGCYQQAREQLLDSPAHPVAGDDPLVARLDREAYNTMLADSRVLTVFKAWSTCMRKRGFEYKDPGDANDDPRWDSGTKPSSLEKATAVADTECKAATNTVGVQYAVESEYQQQLIEQHASELAEVKDLIQQRLKIAAQILGTAP